MAQPVIQELNMPHLAQDAEEAAENLKEKITNLANTTQEGEDNPREAEEYTFKFEWKDARGKSWSGEFTNKILTVLDRQIVGALQAQWQDHKPALAIDPELANMTYTVAHMTVSFVNRPTWAKDLRTLHSLELIQALYLEVLAHEATFHGYTEDQKSSTEES